MRHHKFWDDSQLWLALLSRLDSWRKFKLENAEIWAIYEIELLKV